MFYPVVGDLLHADFFQGAVSHVAALDHVIFVDYKGSQFHHPGKFAEAADELFKHLIADETWVFGIKMDL